MSEAATAKTTFPVFARHHGVWEGTYTRLDARTGELLDHHQSRLTCLIAGNNWRQINDYRWADERTESREFPGVFGADGWLRFDNPRLTGEACEVDPNTIFLTWRYKDEPGNHFTELITLVSDTHRCRVWKHFENGVFAKITIIDENKVGDNP